MTGAGAAPPPGVRTIPSPDPSAGRIVLVRHGEATCNVNGVIGGVQGCSGLTASGRAQVGALADRLARTHELGPVSALYASVLARAVETAQILAPALGHPIGPGGTAWGIVTDCDLCELHPGAADGMAWDAYAATFGAPDWEHEPDRPIAPGGESWSAFVRRASGALRRLAARHAGQTVVVATHAGVVEASMLAFLPVDGAVARLSLRTAHAAMTQWEVARGAWRLASYNDATPCAPS